MLNACLPIATTPGEEMLGEESVEVEACNMNITFGRYSQSVVKSSLKHYISDQRQTDRYANDVKNNGCGGEEAHSHYLSGLKSVSL